ncbi:MAG: transporter substrate-binding domain-containing protein, partial [Alphaproteobacteria bacterium]
TTATKETAYERVMRTGVLRCGYAAWEPMIAIDANTKAIKGIAHDTIEAAAQNLGLKVEWAEEVGWGEYLQSLEQGRIDAFCSGAVPSTERARMGIFSTPFAYTRVGVFARADDMRFDNTTAAINQASTKIGAVDGTATIQIIRNSFPHATLVSIPQSQAITQLFMDVAANKTDLTIEALSTAGLFMHANPNVIRHVPLPADLRVLPNVFTYARHEFALQQLLDQAILELNATGQLETLIARYEPFPQAYYRLAPQYKTH